MLNDICKREKVWVEHVVFPLQIVVIMDDDDYDDHDAGSFACLIKYRARNSHQNLWAE